MYVCIYAYDTDRDHICIYVYEQFARYQAHNGSLASQGWVCEDRRGLGPGEMQAVGRFVRIGTEDF